MNVSNHGCACCPWTPEESIRLLGNGVAGGCELPYGWWALNPDPLQE